MSDSELGFSLTKEEMERALADRPRLPLTDKETIWLRELRDRCPSIDTVEEMYKWFEAGRKREQAKVDAAERRRKLYPVVFGTISALVGLPTLIKFLGELFMHKPPGP